MFSNTAISHEIEREWDVGRDQLADKEGVKLGKNNGEIFMKYDKYILQSFKVILVSGRCLFVDLLEGPSAGLKPEY